MALLALFDVDGTLLLGHDELAVDAFLGALRELYPVDPPDDAFAQVGHRGETSLRIARRILRSEGIRAAAIDGRLHDWCVLFAERYVALLAGADEIGRASCRERV